MWVNQNKKPTNQRRGSFGSDILNKSGNGKSRNPLDLLRKSRNENDDNEEVHSTEPPKRQESNKRELLRKSRSEYVLRLPFKSSPTSTSTKEIVHRSSSLKCTNSSSASLSQQNSKSNSNVSSNSNNRIRRSSFRRMSSFLRLNLNLPDTVPAEEQPQFSFLDSDVCVALELPPQYFQVHCHIPKMTAVIPLVEIYNIKTSKIKITRHQQAIQSCIEDLIDCHVELSHEARQVLMLALKKREYSIYFSMNDGIKTEYSPESGAKYFLFCCQNHSVPHLTVYFG